MVKRLSVLTVMLAVVVGGVWYVAHLRQRQTGTLVVREPAVSPKPKPMVPRVVTAVAPDMKQTLTMKEVQANGLVTHRFLVQGENGEKREIFSRTVEEGGGIVVPFNTWSPGNKYLFLQETLNGKESHVVLEAMGGKVAGDAQMVAVEELFGKKYTDLVVTEVTGWAGPTLLVVNTDKADGSRGPSFWLDTSTLAFIRLSTRFN